MRTPVYLDYAATTPVDPAVAQAMLQCLTVEGAFANPSSSHGPGRAAAALIEHARAQVASLIGADVQEIIFTSGATESNNLALLGVARANADRGRHIVTSRIEHRAVLDPCRRLEREGFRVSYLTPDASGRIDPDSVACALRTDTVLVSIMHVNNEIGVIEDIGAIGAICRARGIPFHTDAAQSAGRVELSLRDLPVDLLSLTAHKIYGPKGVGALYVRRGARSLLKPQSFGGGQESGLRPGTLPTHQIVGFGLAAELALRSLRLESDRLAVLRDRLWSVLAGATGVHLNGEPAPRVPHILNVSFEDVDGESLVAALPSLAVSTGSACHSASGEPSYVLRALGRSTRLAEGSLRFSLGRLTTGEEVDHAAQEVRREVARLRAVSPGLVGPRADPAREPATRGGPSAPTKPIEASGPAQRADAPAPKAQLEAASPVPIIEGAELAGLAGALPTETLPTEALERGRTPAEVQLASREPDAASRLERLFRELPGAGVIPEGAGTVLHGEAGGPSEEVWVRFHLLVDGDSVKDARFEARGCPHTLATAAWLSGELRGRRRDEALRSGPQAWARVLGVPVEKLGRLLVIEDALSASLRSWP
jgi:cysteine desulfurase